MQTVLSQTAHNNYLQITKPEINDVGIIVHHGKRRKMVLMCGHRHPKSLFMVAHLPPDRTRLTLYCTDVNFFEVLQAGVKHEAQSSPHTVGSLCRTPAGCERHKDANASET